MNSPPDVSLPDVDRRVRIIETDLWGPSGQNGLKSELQGELKHQRKAIGDLHNKIDDRERKLNAKIDANDKRNEQRNADLYKLLARIGVGVILGLLAILGTLIITATAGTP